MNEMEIQSRIDRLVRERWTVEETLTTLKAAVRQLLRNHASFDRMRVIARQLQAAIKTRGELEKQLAESHCTVQFVHPL
jgi:hypothetical protein